MMLSPVELDYAVSAYKMGHSISKIAKTLGRGRETIRSHLRADGRVEIGAAAKGYRSCDVDFGRERGLSHEAILDRYCQSRGVKPELLYR